MDSYSPPAKAALLGAPHDANSSFLRGPALAPARIRETFHNGSSNMTTERGVVLDKGGWIDAGDVAVPPQPGDAPAITAAVSALREQGLRVLVLGGDHSITYPVIRATAAHRDPFTILHIDAHPDLYDELDGNRYSHACPFARIMEAGLAARLVQVGIRTLNAHQQAQAERFGVEMIDMAAWGRGERPAIDGPVYISLDLDGLDPAFAPGVSHHEPGGLTSREVLDLIHALPGPIIGADIVEYNPTRDVSGMTAAVAVKFVKELLGRMLA